MTFLNFELIFFDYVVLILTAVIVIFSFWKGFINSILGLLTWVGSVFVTIYSYQYLSDFLSAQLININFLQRFEQFVSVISIIISIPIIFLISLFILKRIRKFLNSDLDKQILGVIFDKFFGILYGILFSYITYSSILYFLFPPKIAHKNKILVIFWIFEKQTVVTENSGPSEISICMSTF